MSKSNKKNVPEQSSDKNVNLLVDGSFETAGVKANEWNTFEKVGGWRSDTGIEVWGKDFITKASDGNKVMEIDADNRDSRVWQDVKTEAGQSYTFSFDYAQRPDTKAATNTIEVWWNNKLVGVVEPGSTAWSKAEFTVKGTGDTDRIEFREQTGDNDSYGGLIDNASLVKSSKGVSDDVGKKPNNDDDKHDGRGHGDGDHNDDGHSDNGRGSKGRDKKDRDDRDDDRDSKHGRKHGDDDDRDDRKGGGDKCDDDKGDKGGKDRNNDEDKHDGRGHGDGDHNDDGHSDNGQGPKKDGDDEQPPADDNGGEQPPAGDNGGEQPPADDNGGEQPPAGGDGGNGGNGDNGGEQPPADDNGGEQPPADDNGGEQPPADDNGGEQPPVVEPPARQIVLSAADILDAKTGEELAGTRGEDDMSGGVGDDHIRGKQGNDIIDGDSAGVFTAPLKISASISDSADLDAVTIVVSNLPKGAQLSAGKDNGGGSWTLKGSELDGLKLTSPDNGEFALKVQAFAADGSGLSASTEVKVTLTGGFDDVLEGGRGNDQISGNAGNDVIYGGSKPTGQPSAQEPQPGDDDTIRGGDGDDLIWAGSGNDKVWGEVGNDWISGGRGNDLLSGGEGQDTIYGNSGDDMFWGDAGDDLIFGGSGNDTIWGGDGADKLNGGSGNDVFHTDGGDDQINGGSGFDTLVLSSSKADFGQLGGTVDLSKGVAGRDDWGWDKLSSIEAVVGGYADDTLTGNTKANLLDGGMGDDTIRGGAGADTLTGGQGNDTFVFLGKDVAKLGGASLGMDLITDFQVGDVVDLTDLMQTRKAALSLKDDGDSTTLIANIKGFDVEIVKLEGFSGHTLDEMLKDGSILL